MRRDYLIAVLLFVAGAALALALMAASLLFPDAPRWALWLCFFFGVSIFIGVLVIAIVIARQGRRRRRPIVIPITIIGSIVVVVAMWVFWPSDIFNKKIPGFSVYSVVKIFNVPEARKKYLFSFENDQKAQFSFYLSSSDIFTLAVADTNGESYPLEIKLGNDGIPLNEFIVLVCEVGITDDETVLRVVVNGKELRRRSIPATLHLGENTLKSAHLGSNPMNQYPGIFEFFEMATYASALTNEDINKLVDNIRGYLKLPFK